MNCVVQFDERHVIPRWKSLHDSLLQSELSNPQKVVAPSSELGIDEYVLSKAQWDLEKNLPNALEFISCAKARGYEVDKIALDFVQKLVSSDSKLPRIIHDFITDKKLFDEFTSETPKSYRSQIAFFRARTILYPNNAFYWAELARYYIIVGEVDKSAKALRISNYLSPNNRFIIRASARFYHHIGEIDHALHILRQSNTIDSDPWLVASEISISRSEGRPSQKMKRASLMLKNDNLYPASISELASEYATIEAIEGDSKESRKLFRKALIKPNENSYAQVVWTNRQVLELQYDTQLIDKIINSFESKVYLELYGAQDWDKINDYLDQWYLFQPFSSIPLLMKSMILVVFLDDYAQTIELCELGLLTHRDNYELKNNLAYALISAGDKLKAATIVTNELSCYTNTSEQILYLATSGMYEMRFGDVSTGITKYNDAIALVQKSNNPEDCPPVIYLAREKKRLGMDISQEQKTIAKILTNTRNPFIPALIKKLEVL